MKRNIKKEKELYKSLNDITEKMDFYEEIYPGRYTEENQKLTEQDLRKLNEAADYFWKTDLYECIMELLKIEKHKEEAGMLSADEIKSGLEIRDMLYLMSREQASDKKKLSLEKQLDYYKMRRQSLSFAMTINNRTICTTETYKNRLSEMRMAGKLEIYFKLLTEKSKELEMIKNG